MDWTDETIARLRELWDQGLSTAEIGRQLEITKNAVVGKAHRLGLPPRPSPIRNRKPVIAADGTVEVPKRKPPTRSKAKPKAAASEQGSLLAEADKKPAAKVSAKVAAPSDAVKVPQPQKNIAAAPGNVSKKIEAVAQSAAQPGAEKQKAGPVIPAKDEEPKRALSSVVGHSGAPRMAPAIDRPVRRGPSCCWPFGDPGTPGFHFCGARPLSGKPYCAEHAAIAYVKIRDRRD
ncbi:GcrA family cell cycle regulator [Neokomagataea thailandica]|uniref:GcrA cell cycle regulator n=1 Tax=Neokomagataea tanensis NBRC 106556 TaxID=1223519 RepID=A0ABQ0QJ86_9PROT|nr:MULTISPECIES: GcrA family cell cycle regulator [Neokomagataea]GBR46801.1 hypothetical protein AA106556_1235 [Neokomagataea tanensis NBRC 106556]